MCVIPATQEAKKGSYGVQSTWKYNNTVSNMLADAFTNIKIYRI